MTILTGLLVGTSYIPFPPWAIFFCWIPLWLTWLQENDLSKSAATRIFWSGWIAQFIFTAIGFSWVSYTVHEFGHLPWIVALAAQAAYCAFANLYVPLAGLAWFGLSGIFNFNRTQKILALPIIMNIGERIFPMIFDWHTGYTWLWAGFPAYQLADIFGFIGLSFFGLIFNALLLYSYLNWREQKRWLPALAAVPLFFLLLNGWGLWHGRQLPPPDGNLKFLIAQANIGNQEKLLAEQGWAFRDTVIQRFVGLTAKGLASGQQVDFAVWPETAFPEVIDDPALSYGYPLKLRQAVSQWRTKLITGGYSRLSGSGKITNSFFVLNEDGHWMAPPYHKTILLAFGEYFPGADLIPQLYKWFPEVGSFGRGPGPSVLTAGSVKIGAQICYEGLFDWFSRSLANKGAEVIVNLTNDSWYGKWQQPYQHLYMTLARAIEVRRPLVRSTNTGISTVILANGDILQSSPLHEEWFYLYEVPYVKNPAPTIFMGWGFWLLPALMLISLLALVWTARKGQ